MNFKDKKAIEKLDEKCEKLEILPGSWYWEKEGISQSYDLFRSQNNA